MSAYLDTLEQSILVTIRGMLGPSEDYTFFDSDLIPLINSAFNRLKQLGVGPKDGFFIRSDDETWGDFFQDTKQINMVITYVYLQVKMVFDPPSNSTTSKSFEDEIKKLEWLMNVDAETVD